jgi:DNA-binding response OmpR family regulator
MSTVGKRILVFEDNDNISMLLRTFLEGRQYVVKIGEDGVDAVALAKDFKPDLIIMDIIMPGKDGIEACTDLRREGITTPVVMLTSKSYDEDKKRALAAGANAYVLKPFAPKTLEGVIVPLLG